MRIVCSTKNSRPGQPWPRGQKMMPAGKLIPQASKGGGKNGGRGDYSIVSLCIYYSTFGGRCQEVLEIFFNNFFYFKKFITLPS